ncbi:MAG: RloB domain-containing protein [Bacteroidales bacterium]|nr:RloB domain-containing protein [Bacteroidales bacterium]
MSGKRNLSNVVGDESPKYFGYENYLFENKGTREIQPLYPFIISGGKNTERYYFHHISNITKYKFNVIPKYFGDESNYTETFPKRIVEILKSNTDAKIFCVFDWDTIHNVQKNLKKHETFVGQFKDEIKNGSVVLCPSMPSIEYWFLLHFEDYTDLIKSCGRKLQALLTPYMLPYFQNEDKKLLNILKKEDCIKEPIWVINLCSENKLENAIKRAENNITAAESNGDLEEHSYSYVYKVFKK